MANTNGERLEKKASFCILIIMKLFPTASENYVEKEAAKMMRLGDGVLNALIERICPNEKIENIKGSAQLILKLKRKINWR